jgi:hypothetical protein
MNAIVWQDVRVSGDVTELSKLGGPDRFRFYGLPVAVLTSPNFGQILGTIGTARQIQFALKFSF